MMLWESNVGTSDQYGSGGGGVVSGEEIQETLSSPKI